MKLVVIRLKSYASLWWENLRRERSREEMRPIQTWEKMKRELKKRFLIENYRQDKSSIILSNTICPWKSI